MSAIWLAVFGLVVFFLGYRFYSKYIAERNYRLDPEYVTPAHQFNDGVDFVPTQKWVLWDHHFTSVAGAAPIVGPAIALYWGWLPALCLFSFWCRNFCRLPRRGRGLTIWHSMTFTSAHSSSTRYCRTR